MLKSLLACFQWADCLACRFCTHNPIAFWTDLCFLWYDSSNFCRKQLSFVPLLSHMNWTIWKMVQLFSCGGSKTSKFINMCIHLDLAILFHECTRRSPSNPCDEWSAKPTILSFENATNSFFQLVNQFLVCNLNWVMLKPELLFHGNIASLSFTSNQSVIMCDTHHWVACCTDYLKCVSRLI